MTIKMHLLCGLAALGTLAERAEAACVGSGPDGKIGATEACDDNNTVNGDGCSTTCDVEGEYSCARPVSFSDLDIENFPGSTAMWNVSPDGMSGIQVINTPAPSITLFGPDAMQGTFSMRVAVKEVNDDDFIGLALGFKQGDQTNPNASYLVIDWKQGLQDGVPPGLRLAHVRGVPTGNGTHAMHPIAQRICTNPTNACARQLATGKTLGSTGWADNTPYLLQLTYRPNRLELRVDGKLELDLRPTDFPGQFPGDVFPAGPLGFYVLSQEQVEVTNLAPRAPSFCNVTSLEPTEISVKPGTPSVTIDTPALLKDADDKLDPSSVSVVSVTGGATVTVRPDGTIELIPADPNRPETYVVTLYACDDDEQLPDCDTTTVTIYYGDSDGDRVPDVLDVCPQVADPDQPDLDGDGLGDGCDDDDDGDGFDDGLGVNGGGCSTTGGGGAGTLVVLGAAALLLRRRRRAAALGGIVALGALAGGGREAAAQISTQYSAERFELTGHRDGILGVEWADVRGHLAVDGGLWLGYANDPVNLYDMATGDRVGALVHSRFGGDLVAAVRLWDRLELGLGAPLVFAQSAELDAGMPGGSLSGAGLGDLRLSPKVTVLRRGRTALAVMASLGLPTSTLDDYGGNDGVSFSPSLAVSHGGARGLRLAANAGYRTRSSARALNLEVDDEVYARGALGYAFASSLEVDATVDFATGADDMLGASNRNHAELRGGVSYDVTPAVRLFGAAGLGVAEGFGTPDWRTLVGVRLGRGKEEPRRAPRPLPPSDRDGDGILDVADRCPTEAETKNGFVDDDGCPDDPDPDRDGLMGAADQCPNEPEDMDGFQDGNGCPDPDNDGDTVLDVDDKCRDMAGVVAMQGCPEPDRDGDKVVDRLDNCPDEPGKPELAGCNQEQRVKIGDGKLEILDIVYFATNAEVIQPQSFAILDEVARVLSAHPEIAKIRVEGHTDDQGDDVYNKRLSQRRAEAVRAYLTQKGVAAGRLEAVGFGEEQPKADNATAPGRATNRRVEFMLDTPVR
ncbi:MAG TPA: OmpA family protein [Kofleriaceae bacterium]|nr:OmpA family protein [Kofleriaceae bacterium]